MSSVHQSPTNTIFRQSTPAERRAWTLLIWGIGVIPAILSVAWPRSWLMKNELLSRWGRFLAADDYYWAVWIGRSCTIWVILLALYLLVRNLPRRGIDPCGWSIGPPVIALSLSYVLAAFWGTISSFPPGLCALPLLILVVLVIPPIPAATLLESIKKLLLLYIYSSLLACAVVPDWALEFEYGQSFIPGFDIRLHGFMINQGQMALTCVTLLVILLRKPRPPLGWIDRIHLLAITLALIMTQSKISWLLCFVLLAWISFRNTREVKPLERPRRIFFSFGLVAVGCVLAVILSPSISDDTLSDQRISTASGRTEIWSTTLDLWNDNPTFGYGLGLWNREMALRMKEQMGWEVVHSHNQFIHLLGQTGLVGLMAFLWYFAAFIIICWRADGLTGGFSLCVAIVHIVRSFTEVWHYGTTNDGYLFFHICCVAVSICAIRTHRTSAQRDTSLAATPSQP